MNSLAEKILMSPEAYRLQAELAPFYAGGSIPLMEYWRPAGEQYGKVTKGGFGVSNTVPNLDPGLRREVTTQVARKVKVVRSGSSSIELVVLDALDGNPHAPVMLNVSTYTSSTKNPGNVSEIADAAIIYPDHRISYAASPGNGGTSAISNEDGQADYINETGRYTWLKNGRMRGVQFVQDLHRALAKAGVEEVALFGADSAGGAIVTALAVELEQGQMTHAALSGRSGFADLTRRQIIAGIAIREQFLNSYRNRRISMDPERLTKERADEAEEIMAAYEYLDNRRELEAAQTPFKDTFRSMWLAEEALRKGDRGDTYPLKYDADAMHLRHPGAYVSYLLALHDPLYDTPGLCYTNARRFLEKIEPSDADVRAVFVPGTHAWNTHFPQFYHSVKMHALSLGAEEKA